jgi:hypothetical protein
MSTSPEAWRRIVTISGAAGLILAFTGYIGLQQQSLAYRAPATLAFFGGFGLVIAAIVLWYRHVPPRPPAPEEQEEMVESEDGGED